MLDNVHLDYKGEVLKDIAFFILQEKASSIIFKEVTKMFIKSSILDTLSPTLDSNKDISEKLM